MKYHQGFENPSFLLKNFVSTRNWNRTNNEELSPNSLTNCCLPPMSAALVLFIEPSNADTYTLQDL